jgi:CRISPR-associated protein Cas4
VARPNPRGGFIIAAGEVGAYTVCPQSWHLEWNDRGSAPPEKANSALGQRLHTDWSRFFEESFRFVNWIRLLMVLACLTAVVFMLISSSRAPLSELFQLSYRNRGLQALFLVILSLWLAGVFKREAKRRHSESGFSQSEVTLAIDGGQILPEREYISESQGLAGKPDAIVKEGEFFIPVERKPLARKLRDRYVAQLLVYMRLVEEFEGKRPPHGYLLLGASCRRVKVVNSPSKQRWLDQMLSEMRGVLAGAPPKPTPHPAKCSKCEVRDRCSARMER